VIFLRIGAWAMGLLAVLSLGVLAVGFLLPSTWSAGAELHIEAPPEAIHPLVHRAQGWLAWTPGPETGVETFGPEAGVGSGYRWDDPGYGRGEFTLTRDEDTGPTREVGYEVEVEGGSIRIRGVLTLAPEGTGTRVTWREEGDFGWNPLLGYLSGRMEELQGEQLLQSLGTLRDRVESGRSPAETPEGPVDAGGAAADAPAVELPSAVSPARPG
jgi:hypothetical protein